MTKDVSTLVGENRRDILNNFGRFEQVDVDRQRSFTFGLNVVDVSVDATVEARDTGDQVIFDHRDGSRHGFDRGVFGTDAAAWRALGGSTTSSLSVPWLVRMLSTSASDGVTRLRQDTQDDEHGNFNVSGKPDDNVRRLSVVFPTVRYDAGDGSSTTFEAVDPDDNTVVTVDVDATKNADITPSDDLRVVLDVTVDGNGLGNGIITTNAESTVADLFDFVDATAFEPSNFVFSNQEGTLSKASTSLENEQFTSDLTIRREAGDLEVRTEVTPPDTSGVTPTTIKQVGVEDADGALLFATPTVDTPVADDTVFVSTLVFRVT